MQPLKRCLLLVSLVIVIVTAQPALAVPVVFNQLPLNGGLAPSVGGAPYAGHGNASTATMTTPPSYIGTFAADDFALTAAADIVHVEWYGSYTLNQKLGGASQFLVAFESDVPAGIGPSHPGVPLLSQIVTLGALAPGSGTFSETAIASAGLTQLYHYSAELALPFTAAADTVYWLKIVALNNQDADGGTYLWNWQARDYSLQNPLAPTAPDVTPGESLTAAAWHFQDAAVTGAAEVTPIPGSPRASVQQVLPVAHQYINGIDGPQGISAIGEDLAFSLSTVSVPEPGTLSLAGMGAVALALLARGRRRTP